jgi:hypothetical protein
MPKGYKQVDNFMALREYMEMEHNQRDYNSMTWQLGNHFKLKDRTISGEEALLVAKDNLHMFKHILFFDNLEEGLVKIAKDCAVDGRYEYPVTQGSDNQIHSQNIDMSIIKEIIKRNQLDIELYNYAKEVFND